MTVMKDRKRETTMGALLDEPLTEASCELNTQIRRVVNDSQKTIYTLLLDLVKRKHPSFVLALFKDLFINLVENVSSAPSQAIHKLVEANNGTEFRNTLKRCCYILVNNWEVSRDYQAIRELIDLFNDPVINQKTPFVKIARLRKWLNIFLNSKDYEELKIYSLRHEIGENIHWSYRYSSYLLVNQYTDTTNPVEQRKAARTRSKELKQKFKFDLAMYTARASSPTLKEQQLNNPTSLGDDVINLIKLILAKRGQFNYVNLANIFGEQTQHLNYADFKESLKNYLIFSLDNKDLAILLRAKLDEKLNNLYDCYNDEPVTKLLLLKTCQHLIEYFTTENKQSPAEIFLLFIFQQTPLALVILLLKVVLICQPSRLHLETCIANLIRYYEDLPEEECKWVINFIDIFNIAFTIYTEDVEYNLIKMSQVNGSNQSVPSWENYRVFSQVKGNQMLELPRGEVK
ncbi:MAG TPA: hypothetical protein V6D28_00220 [Leptolyngbyaceae cyanobacterium]